MRYIKLGGVRAFPGVQPTKEQAIKVLEEASDVHGAWQMLESTRENMHDMLAENGWDESCASKVIECMYDAKYCKARVFDELADTKEVQGVRGGVRPALRQAGPVRRVHTLHAGREGRTR